MLFKNSLKIDSSLEGMLNHLGYGVFETFLVRKRSQNQAVILGLTKHLNRLKSGAETLGLNFESNDYYADLLNAALSQFEWVDISKLRCRIVLQSSDCFIQLSPYNLSAKYLKLKSLEMPRPLPEVKSCSAVISVLSAKIAIDRGYDEALLLNSNRNILEGSWSNFFCIDKDERILCPANGMLRGVTREIVCNLAKVKYEVVETDIDINSISTLAACFMTRSTLGIEPVIQIDEIAIPQSEIVQQLSKDYDSLFTEDHDLISVYSI